MRYLLLCKAVFFTCLQVYCYPGQAWSKSNEVLIRSVIGKINFKFKQSWDQMISLFINLIPQRQFAARVFLSAWSAEKFRGVKAGSRDPIFRPNL